MGKSRTIIGIVFVALGIILLLKVFGLINFSFGTIFLQCWPVLFIIIGIGLLLHKGKLVIGIVLLILILGAIFGAFPRNNTLFRNIHHTIQEIEVSNQTTLANIDIQYGAGNLLVEKGNRSLIQNIVETSDENDPAISSHQDNSTIKVNIARNQPDLTAGPNNQDKWDIKLTDRIKYSLTLNYGAANVKLDLKDLDIDSLNIKSGATNTGIIFGPYPTKVEINTGASNYKLKFPSNYGVRVIAEEGLSTIKLPGFTKQGNQYVNSYYTQDGDNIEINIKAGFSNIEVI
jgi:hypothetical protein